MGGHRSDDDNDDNYDPPKLRARLWAAREILVIVDGWPVGTNQLPGGTVQGGWGGGGAKALAAMCMRSEAGLIA